MTKLVWKNLLNFVLENDEVCLNCQDCYDLLDQYVEMLGDNTSPAEVMPLVKQHLEQCSYCDELLETLLVMLHETGQPASPAAPLP